MKDLLSDGDHWLAYIDDTHTSSLKQRARDILASVWKLSCGIEPTFIFMGAFGDELEKTARTIDPSAWFGEGPRCLATSKD